MKRYFIEKAEFGITSSKGKSRPILPNIVATFQYKDDEAGSKWLSLIEVNDIPNFYIFDEDTHEKLVGGDYENEDFNAYLQEHAIQSFNGIEFGNDYYETYDSITEDPENPAVPLIRYMILLVRCPEEDLEELIEAALGKYADELDIPASDVEEDYLAECDDYYIDLQDVDKEDLYRMKLYLETELEEDSVYHDMDPSAVRIAKAHLKAVNGKCEDPFDYDRWKDDYIEEEYAKLEDQKFITCSYMFIGVGQYKMTLPAEGKESFDNWIKSNGSAFPGDECEATEEEVKTFIALHAAPWMG